ncbi:MAG: DUF1731 domain-containing protein [Cyclobacteriaceae bacterium]|nr:DUF1731 domain-containing protein [Cyclobacteriaceae bacterium]
MEHTTPVAPHPVTNNKFLKTLVDINGKPFFLPGIPKFLLQLGLGEMAKAIAGGNNVSSKKITEFRLKISISGA